MATAHVAVLYVRPPAGSVSVAGKHHFARKFLLGSVRNRAQRRRRCLWRGSARVFLFRNAAPERRGDKDALFLAAGYLTIQCGGHGGYRFCRRMDSSNTICAADYAACYVMLGEPHLDAHG